MVPFKYELSFLLSRESLDRRNDPDRQEDVKAALNPPKIHNEVSQGACVPAVTPFVLLLAGRHVRFVLDDFADNIKVKLLPCGGCHCVA